MEGGRAKSEEIERNRPQIDRLLSMIGNFTEIFVSDFVRLGDSDLDDNQIARFQPSSVFP